MPRTHLLARRTIQLLIGLVLYAASIALLVHASIGSMPWDVLTQGIVNHIPVSFGAVTAATGLLVLLCWIPLRQRPGVGTIANIIVISALVDPFLALLDRLPATTPLALDVAAMVIGVVLNGLATALYIGARMGPGPRDGLMTGLVRRTGRSVRLVRSSIEVTVVLTGWLLGGTVGAGTLVYAVAIGPLVHLLLPRFSVPQAVPVAPRVDDALRGAEEVRTGTGPASPAASEAVACASGTPG